MSGFYSHTCGCSSSPLAGPSLERIEEGVSTLGGDRDGYARRWFEYYAPKMANRNTFLMYAMVVVGAIVGVAIEWLFRSESDRRLYVAAFAGAWLAMGVAAMVTGDLSVAGDSISPGLRSGVGARVLGMIMIVAALSFYFVVAYVR